MLSHHDNQEYIFPENPLKFQDLSIPIRNIKYIRDSYCKHFYRNSQTITSSSTETVSFDGQVAKLSISKVTKELTGTIKVIVTNEFGTDESTAELVLGKFDECI